MWRKSTTKVPYSTRASPCGRYDSHQSGSNLATELLFANCLYSRPRGGLSCLRKRRDGGNYSFTFYFSFIYLWVFISCDILSVTYINLSNNLLHWEFHFFRNKMTLPTSGRECSYYFNTSVSDYNFDTKTRADRTDTTTVNFIRPLIN